MFWLSCKNQAFAQYTAWIYVETAFLAPAMPYYSVARQIGLMNTLGMGLGIHCFYAVTGYKLLREFGANNLGPAVPFVHLIAIDFLVHWLPCIILWYLFSADWRLMATEPLDGPSLWIGIMTGSCHSTYTYLLGHGWDPRKLYNVKKTPCSMSRICTAWLLLFVGHASGPIILPKLLAAFA
jgi:hypothetical protein